MINTTSRPMSNDDLPLGLDAALDPARSGHKATVPAELRKAGHRVPDGFVVPLAYESPPNCWRLRWRAWDRAPMPCAPRAWPRIAEASFAGQYETVLGAETIDEVLAATKKVLASARAAHVASYRASTDVPEDMGRRPARRSGAAAGDCGGSGRGVHRQPRDRGRRSGDRSDAWPR